MNNAQEMTLAEFQRLLEENGDQVQAVMTVDDHDPECPLEHKLLFTANGFALYWSCSPNGEMRAIPLSQAGEPIDLALDTEAMEADAKAAAEQAEIDLEFAAIVAGIDIDTDGAE